MAGSNGNSSYYDLFGDEPQYYDSPSLSAQPAAQPTTKPVAQPVPKTPTFDPNLGRDTVYNEQYGKYKKELGLRGVFGRKKAKQYFDQQFNEDWNNSAQDRQNKALEGMGYTYNGSGWDLPAIKEPQPVQNPAQKAASGFWDAMDAYDQNVKKDVYVPNQNLKTNGLNFNDTKAVQQWLTDNGFDTKGVDGMYGTNTRNAIDNMLNSNNFTLTADEKEKFRNFQNSSKFYGAKTPAHKVVNTPNGPVSMRPDAVGNNPLNLPSFPGRSFKRGGLIKKHQLGGGFTGQPYTGASLNGVMNAANQMMNRYNIANKFGMDPSNLKPASPEMQQAAMSAINNSSFNFDSPEFDPNAGRQEAYDKRRSEYMTQLANSGKKRINMNKANKEFDAMFEQDWADGEAERRNAHNEQARNTRMQAFNDYWQGRMVDAQDAITKAYEEAGYTFDPATGKWNAPAPTPAPTPEPAPGKSNDYWNQQAQQYGFADMNAVAEWQRQNGLEADGKFGQNSLTKWNELQAASQTQAPQKSIGRDIADDMPIVGSFVTGRDFIKDPSKQTAAAFGKRLLWDTVGAGAAGFRVMKGLWDGAKGWWNSLPENKQGGTLIKRHQQGGNVEQDIQAQVKQLVQAVAAGDQQAAEQVKQIMQAAEQGDQQALQIAQMIQAEIEAIKSAKRGAKLNYIKSLKGDCPDGEEVVYFQKGGQLCKACQKKHDKMIAEKGKKLNPVEEFKKGRKTKKC